MNSIPSFSTTFLKLLKSSNCLKAKLNEIANPFEKALGTTTHGNHSHLLYIISLCKICNKYIINKFYSGIYKHRKW